jgi:transcriptional regulator with XRE-family HTH domain
MSFDVERIPTALRLLRIQRGLKQVDMERASGLSRRRICNWEKGRSLPKLQSLLALLRALGCDFGDLPHKAGICSPGGNQAASGKSLGAGEGCPIA